MRAGIIKGLLASSTVYSDELNSILRTGCEQYTESIYIVYMRAEQN